MKAAQSESRVRAKHFPASVFVATFVVFALLTTLQNSLLRDYIDHLSIPPKYYTWMTIYWVAVSAIFTYFTRWQIIRSYERPLKQLADATQKVANGDFSVYVRPLHTADKADYLDFMMEDFNKMVAELGSIETLKTEFVSNVSHEIKTPLAAIQSSAEILMADDLTERLRKEYASVIIQSSKRLSDLIANILKLNRLEQQKIRPAPQTYDLCAQLVECALQFEEIWNRKKIDFSVDLEDRLTIAADASLMELVWNNLLSNALKFTPAGGAVEIVQTSTEEEAIVTISDSGCGMDEKTLRHIFDKFYQGDTSHAAEGNGLGLALALRVIQLSGGTIAADSNPGKGSVFTVRLPLFAENAESPLEGAAKS